MRSSGSAYPLRASCMRRSTSRPSAARSSPAYDARVQPIYEQEEVVIRDPRFAGQISEAQALEEYVRSQASFAKDADDLLRLGRDLINDVVSGA